MKKIIKIDRIKNIKEALELQNLGVDIICVSLCDNPMYRDDRIISIRRAIKIREKVDKCVYVGEFFVQENYKEILRVISKIGFDMIQISTHLLPPIEFVEQLNSMDIKIIWAGITPSNDTDKSWILMRYEEYFRFEHFFQLDLLGDLYNAWNHLKLETPKYPDYELQISEICELAKEHNIFVTIDFTKENIIEILHSLYSIKGITIPISKSTNRNDVHFFYYHEVIELLRHMI